MHGGINVDILQVLQGLCVEEAKGRPRGEGNPNANTSHSHVGDDHPFILVGLQLILRKQTEEMRLHRVLRVQPELTTVLRAKIPHNGARPSHS